MIRPILFLALTMSVLGAIAQEPAPPKANAEMQQWLETVEAQWQAALTKEATTPFEDEKAKLVQQYSAAIETNLNKASSAGNLDLAVLWRNERDRFAGAKEVPADDDATTPPELKQLRVAWRAQMARLEKDRTERTKAVQVRYDQVLEKAQTQFTQQQRLDEAVMVKNKREQIAARGPGPQVPATAPATADVPAQSGVPAGLVGTWRVRWPQNGWQATRTISGDGTFTSSDGGPGTWKLAENTLVLQFRNHQETFDLPLKPGGTKVIGYKKRELVAKREETATPRAPVTPATPVAPAAPLSTNLEALKSLFTGSRWECFSSPNLVGRPYWVEFYRDGKMYSEWSEAYHWEIIPPSAIKITGGNSGKTEWVLVVDAAKKEGRPDPNLNRGGARSIRYLKSISANPPKGVKF